MSDRNDRSEQVKRAHEDREKMEATLQEKRQKKLQQQLINAAKGRLVEAMKKKDVVGVDKELESYIELAGTIKSDIVAVLFNSLASASDEQYLTKWTSLAEKYKVDIPENAYACIIQYYTGIGNCKKAWSYVSLMLEKRIELRGRNYSPILECISRKGDLRFLETVLSHMQANAIDLDELMYSYILRTCIKAKQPNQFISYLNQMMKTIQVIQKDGPCIHVLQEFSLSYPRWVLRKCNIVNPGNCSVCGCTLSKQTLSVSEKMEIGKEIEALVNERSKEQPKATNFADFKAFLAANGPFDIILDGANIAHFKQNFEGGGFNYQQIDMIANYLISQGYHILIVLHEHHFGQPHTTLPEEWLEKNLAFKVIRGNNDDWYWMYASMATEHNTMILSNDQMRDHFFQIENDMRFQIWREHNQIYYDMWTLPDRKEFKLIMPLQYTQRIQNNNERYHFPCGIIEQNMKHIDEYWCLVDTEKSKKNEWSGCHLMYFVWF